MTLTVLDCADHIDHTLSGPLSIASALDIVNQTGEHLVGMNQWMFLRRPPGRIKTRTFAFFTSGTWTEATKNLFRNGAWTFYTFLAGDEIEILAGTGATLGFYKVAAKVDNSNITLETSIGSAADGEVDIECDMHLTGVALPSDFGGLIAAPEGDLNYVTLTTMDEIMGLRANDSGTGGIGYLGAIVFGQLAAGGAPVPRMELWPEASAVETLLLAYRAGWTQIGEPPTSAIPVPSHIEPLYVALLRAFARGYEEEDQGTLSQRLAEIEMGPVFAAARQRDGSTQRNYGQIRGGWLGRPRASVHDYPFPLGGAS